jgi:hypothetical protein
MTKYLRRRSAGPCARPGIYFGVKDNPLELDFHCETPIGRNHLDR